MSDPLVVDLFVEDVAHEVFVGALVGRVAREEQIQARVQARSARGGHPRAIAEFRTYQMLAERGALVDAMNLYRAGRNDSSLKAFVDDLRGRFREARGGPGGGPSS